MRKTMKKHMDGDPLIYSYENVLEQLKKATCELGYFHLRFYTNQGLPAKNVTDTVSDFYLYPSGGALRDASFNIILYDSRFDLYRGFKPPTATSS